MKDKEAQVKVLAKANGPIIITGSFTFENEDGKTEEIERLVLCRCGESGRMPLCDASHNRVGFCSK
jgi:CDGSH-type Zn-finger protein